MTCYLCDATSCLAFVGDVPQCRRCRGDTVPATTIQPKPEDALVMLGDSISSPPSPLVLQFLQHDYSQQAQFYWPAHDYGRWYADYTAPSSCYILTATNGT